MAEHYELGEKSIRFFYDEFLPEYTKEVNELKSINDIPMKLTLDIPSNSKVKITKNKLGNEFANICMFQAEKLIAACDLRLQFISRMDGFLPREEMNKISKLVDKIITIRE